MARSNPPQAADYRSFIVPKGVDVEGDFRFKLKETRAERKQRLWKEKMAFLVGDLGATISAWVITLVLIVLSGVLLIRSKTPEDRSFATLMRTAVGTAVVGFACGRSSQKLGDA